MLVHRLKVYSLALTIFIVLMLISNYAFAHM
jgi:hypothetical protein